MELVVSHFNEDLNFLDKPEWKVYDKITIYTKSDIIPIIQNKNCEIYSLENIGMCDHTYMYHICKNYENLKDVVTFIPASFSTSQPKLLKFHKTYEKTIELKKSVFCCSNEERNVNLQTLNFILDEWYVTNPRNREKNSYSKLEPCHIRPFCKWYNENINEEYNKICCGGIFSVSIKDIMKRELSFYERLLNEFKYKNSEYAHYIERSWMAIFKIEDDCVYYY